MSVNKLKCKLCNYTTKRWTTRKGDKKRVHGFARLIDHVMRDHSKEFEKIEAWVDIACMEVET